MAAPDSDLTLYFRKKYTPPPSVLLLKLPSNNNSNKTQQHRTSPSVELRSRQQKKPQTTPHTVRFNVSSSDTRELSLSPYGWQRHSDKVGQITPAPDVAYKYTYMDETKNEKSTSNNNEHHSCLSNSRSPSPRSQHSQQQQHQQLPRLKTASSSSYHSTDSSQRKYYHQYRTVYDYIRQSIKQIERQRDLKQQNFSARVKRPQNEDAVLRRVLGDKKGSASSKVSSISKNDLRNPQNLLNYINHSREQVRVLHTTTPNQYYQSPLQHETDYKLHRQRTNLSNRRNDSPEKQQSIMMVTATVANS